MHPTPITHALDAMNADKTEVFPGLFRASHSFIEAFVGIEGGETNPT